MAKNIIFCADGTWNGPGKDLDGETVPTDPSNVLKLYHWLDGKDTMESMGCAGESERILTSAGGIIVQHAKYLDGVGYDQNWLVRFIGGVFGSGIITRIVRGYTFISRNYQDGDNIYIVGFSRGAYTARALAGLIIGEGLLKNDNNLLNDKESAYRLGCAVWNQHQSKIKKTSTGIIASLAHILENLPGFFSKTINYNQLIPNIQIKSVAVWDTVGSLGIPKYEGENERVDTFRFADLDLNPNVQYGFHALALDEQRVDFTPSIWNPRSNITQTVFPGGHADVGGSYPLDQSGLSDNALSWIKTHLESVGVKFGIPTDKFSPNPTDTAHQQWLYPPYTLIPDYKIAPRSFPPNFNINTDSSIHARINAGMVKPDPSLPASHYEPENIP